MRMAHLSPVEVHSSFPEFQRVQPLERGGQKFVLRATDHHGHDYALKLVPRDDGTGDERALREIWTASQLKAPCFASVRDFGIRRVNGHNYIFIVEDFIHGPSLKQLLEREGAQPISVIRRVGHELLVALTHLEDANVVHRDIKPSNILLPEDDRVVLIDFGIARVLDKRSVTSSFAIFGPMTIGYSAPEQIQNLKRQISIRTDLFALGVVLYEMATEVNPFRSPGSSTEEVLQRCLSFDPPELHVLGHPNALSSFVKSCMTKVVHRRPPSAREALRMFRDINWEEA